MFNEEEIEYNNDINYQILNLEIELALDLMSSSSSVNTMSTMTYQDQEIDVEQSYYYLVPTFIFDLNHFDIEIEV